MNIPLYRFANALTTVSDLATIIALYEYTMGLKFNSSLSTDLGIHPVLTILELLERATRFIKVEEREEFKINKWRTQHSL